MNLKNLSFVDIFIIFLVVLNVLPFLAAFFSILELKFLSEPIYLLYSLFCHQFHWRSIHIADTQLAWCTRDVFIWGAFLVTALAYRFKYLDFRYNWYWIFPFMVPIALDGGIQTIATVLGVSTNEAFYLSTNLMRAVTGAIFGIGLGTLLIPFINEIDNEKLNIAKRFF